MKRTLIIDLEDEYIKKNQEKLKELKKNYNILLYNKEDGSVFREMGQGLVVLSDDEQALSKWREYAVLAVEHGKRIYGISYVVDELEDVDEEYLQVVYARRFGIPLVIWETERLIIREIAEEDAKAVCALYEDKDNTRFLPAVGTLNEEREQIRTYAQNMYGFYGYGMWVVIRKNDNRLIGRAGIEHRMIGGELHCEIGYFIEKKFQGMGYGMEAAGAVLGAAEKLEMEELIAYIHEKNIPSIKLAQRLGFSFWQEFTDGERFLVYQKKI